MSPPAYRSRNDQEYVVHPIVHILSSQAPLQEPARPGDAEFDTGFLRQPGRPAG